MQKTIRVPTYQHHKPTNTARVWMFGRLHSLGRFDSPSSYARYDQLIAEWRAAGCPSWAPMNDPTVGDVAEAFFDHIEPQYPKEQVEFFKLALRPLAPWHETPVREFGPRSLKAVRETMVEKGWKRGTVNRAVAIVKRAFRWAAEEEMIDPSAWHGIQAVQGLRRGRTAAPESIPVPPVPIADVEATIEALPAVVGDMVRVQLLTGTRPGEVCAMTTGAIERSGRLWLYELKHHKTAHHGKRRVVAFGPKAQSIITPYLRLAKPDAPIFSPAVSEELRLQEREANRKTPKSCGNRRGSRRVTKRTRPPGDRYTTASYRRAIERAAAKAGVEDWTPNQLRHTRATEIRRTYGLEAASAVLGHSNVETTQVYAERDMQIMLRVAQETG